MKVRKLIWIPLVVIAAICLASSGFIYNALRENSQSANSNELANLQVTFLQQYGSDATIKQLVCPDKVYAAAWTSSDGATHISWNIGGLWVTVYSSEIPSGE